MRALLFVLLLFACSSTKEISSEDCVKRCEQQNMMRAVSPEMIRADCERECSKN